MPNNISIPVLVKIMNLWALDMHEYQMSMAMFPVFIVQKSNPSDECCSTGVNA